MSNGSTASVGQSSSRFSPDARLLRCLGDALLTTLIHLVPIINVEPNRVEIFWDDDTGGWCPAAEQHQAAAKLLPEGDDATTRLQVRFAQSMAVENRQSGCNARPDYERSLLAAYAAFASPLAWDYWQAVAHAR